MENGEYATRIKANFDRNAVFTSILIFKFIFNFFFNKNNQNKIKKK
jgi:hypothetical protein